MYDVDFTINPFEEEYIGTNGHKYINYFYIAFVKENCHAFLDKKNAEQFREISQINWVHHLTALKKVRYYENSKIFLIKEVNKGWPSRGVDVNSG